MSYLTDQLQMLADEALARAYGSTESAARDLAYKLVDATNREVLEALVQNYLDELKAKRAQWDDDEPSWEYGPEE